MMIGESNGGGEGTPEEAEAILAGRAEKNESCISVSSKTPFNLFALKMVHVIC
jgi:hypothetical protein